MITLISPAKTQDFESKSPVAEYSEPAMLKESVLLFKQLRALSVSDISALMSVSKKIAELNYERFRHFKTPFTPQNAKQAVYAFQGDVYDGLQAEHFDKKALAFAQKYLRILSGLYGILRPLDLIQPYRLEMKIRLANKCGKDLYDFWGERITKQVNYALAETKSSVVVNLASQEYFKVIQPARLNATIITPQFKEKKAGGYQMIALFAKRARGALAGYIARNQITEPDALNFFEEDGYRLNVTLSEKNSPVFTRG